MSDNSSKGGGKPSPKEDRPASNWSDLQARLISALVLASAVLFITWSGLVPFALLLTLGGIILCWEWAKMVRGTDFDELLVLHAISVTVSCWLFVYGQYGVALLVLLVGPAVKFFMAQDEDARKLGISLFGVPYIGLALVSLIWLRSDAQYGWRAILYLFIVVWSVDIFAYVFGRSFGGPKLAPRISPKKTWSGFLGGVGSGALAGMAFGALATSGTSLPALGLVSLVIGVLSQMGDLFESVFKRHFNVKDASNLIPGHGGLFDRVDGLMFGAMAAALIALWFDAANPGANLLIWGQGG